eukprot:2986351-Prymnesium_polylepis.1
MASRFQGLLDALTLRRRGGHGQVVGTAKCRQAALCAPHPRAPSSSCCPACAHTRQYRRQCIRCAPACVPAILPS